VKRTLRSVWSPQRRNRREVDIYLPRSYRTDVERRYPVVYMHDGQNLSEPSTAFAGTWDLEATLARLDARGFEAIVVGVHHAGDERIVEYSPFPDEKHDGGEADAYLAFLAETLKPRVDRLFRTSPHRAATSVLGSSMGGLVSLYAYFRYPSVFGRAGAMSPSVWFGRAALLDFVAEAKSPRGRIYVDVGALEGATTLRDARRLGRLLVKKGFVRDRRSRRPRRPYAGPERRASRADARARLRYVEDAGGRHHEAAWARRLEGALAFLIE
jgi:predicted alpha/beta superfamily hydrolase